MFTIYVCDPKTRGLRMEGHVYSCYISGSSHCHAEWSMMWIFFPSPLSLFSWSLARFLVCFSLFRRGPWQPRLASNFLFCYIAQDNLELVISGTGMTGVCHHFWFYVILGITSRDLHVPAKHTQPHKVLSMLVPWHFSGENGKERYHF